MMQTEIKIVQYNVSGQVIAAFNLDLYDNVPIPVNKSIIDIKEPQKRKSDYTLPITVPGTANNRSIFSNIQNLNRSTKNSSSINYSPDFNVNLKAEALVIRGGIILMRGNLQLTQIPIQDEDVEFELVIIGKLANLFQDLGDKKLSDISLSEYDHTWNSMTVANSWANYIIKNGNTYNNFNVSGDPNGEGYVYPLIDNGLSTNSAELEYELEKSMYPAVYVKQIVDKIFSEAGYRYQSNFFESRIFKKLIVPFTGGSYTNTENEVNDRTWIVENSTTLNYQSTQLIVSELFVYDFNTIVKDTSPAGVSIGNDWVQIQSGNNGNYVITFEGDLTLTNNATITANGDAYVKVFIKRDRSGVVTVLNPTLPKDLASKFTFTSVAPNGSVTKTRKEISQQTSLISGDKIYIEFQYFNDTINGIDMTEMSLDVDVSRMNSSPSVIYAEGNSISVSASLPKNVKQADFLSYLFKMFNLYAVSDKIDENKLIIEPRDDFYTNDVIDLTNNLDVSKEQVIEPMGALDFREMMMSYSEDNDEYNSRYQNQFQESYGTKRFTIENDFLTQSQEVKIGLAASPLASSLNAHDRIYTKIRREDPTTQQTDVPAYKLRVLFYGGLIPTVTGWSLKTKLNGTINYAVDFPYAGMLDNVSNPEYDLSFGQPKAIYYGSGTVTYTNGNLFNRYWKKNIDEITDKDSKIYTAYFKLNEVEFNNLSFQKTYLINQQYYRLNNVSHDLNSDNPVKIEFLRLKNALPFTLQSAGGNGGSGGTLDSEDLPAFDRSDNTKFFKSVNTTQFRTKEQSGDDMFLNFGSDINFVESIGDVYLPDADNAQPETGDPIIIVKNINGGSVKVYPINSDNLINGAGSYTLQNHHCVWFVAYKGNWQIITTGNTGGG